MNRDGRVRVKICGMTRLSDALCAAEAGVDALGFIFYDKSQRAITPQAARVIIDQVPPFVDTVGVFVDETVERVAAIVRECGLSHAQLHGAESPSYCRELRALIPSIRLLKAVRVGTHTTSAELAPYHDSIQGYLLDTYQKNVVGGTGQAFDWTIIDRLHITCPFLLAGGLDIGNIHEALCQVRPYAVDANSGLEDAPGIKNHRLMCAFIALVQQRAVSPSP